jgi:hypothetical protein
MAWASTTLVAAVLARILRLLAGLLTAALLLAGLVLATLVLTALVLTALLLAALLVATLVLTALLLPALVLTTLVLTALVGIVGVLIHHVLSCCPCPQSRCLRSKGSNHDSIYVTELGTSPARRNATIAPERHR